MDRRLAVEASGTGPRLVLVHGFTQTSASWRRLRPHLPAGSEVMAVDLPGHGGSTQVAAPSLERCAELLGATAGRGTYVGYSLGGRVCLTLALRRPQLVGRLVLVSATAGIEDPVARRTRRADDEALAGAVETAGDAGLPEFLGRWLAGPLFAHLDPEQADVASRLSNTAAGLAASLRGCGTGTQLPSWHRLGSLTMPVLLVAGELDERFAAIGRRMAAAIGASARLELLAGAGHAACFERPAAFGAVLGRFLAGPATGTAPP